MRLASRGTRNLDNGEEKVEDQAIAEQLRRQANKVQIEAVAVAGALTAILFLLPSVAQPKKQAQ